MLTANYHKYVDSPETERNQTIHQCYYFTQRKDNTKIHVLILEKY